MFEQLTGDARDAVEQAPPTGHAAYSEYCRELARALSAAWPRLRQANEQDIAAARERGLPEVLVQRLRLTDDHLRGLVSYCESVHTRLPSAIAGSPEAPVHDWGTLRRVPKPLGVVLMVYEARPTVTVEGALLPVAVGNAVLLRGGKEIAATASSVASVAKDALRAVGLPPGLVTVLDDSDRTVLRELLNQPDAIDVLLPRGSPSLLDYCRKRGSLPVIASGGGVNHLYVHRSADTALASRITLDSKLPEPAGCTSVEVILVDREVAPQYLGALRQTVREQRERLTVRLDPSLVDAAEPARDDEEDWQLVPLGEHDLDREFMDRTVAVTTVDGPRDAVAHVGQHGSGHTEGIVGTDKEALDTFVSGVDAAAVIVNGSLRLHDGPSLGLGPEISISTNRLHVRGPVDLPALMTHTWVVDAGGTLRADVEANQGAAHAYATP